MEGSCVMEEMSALQVLSLMPSKKREIESFNIRVKDALMGGIIDPLLLLSNLKAIEKSIKELLSDDEISDVFLTSMNGDKRVEEYGCVFETAEVGTKYDYSICSEWNEIEEKVKDLKEQQKAVETRLKSATNKCPYYDPTTGEAIVGIPKSSKSSIKVTLK